MWLKKLKIAIIENNTDQLNSLMDSLPQLNNSKEIEEALNLIQLAKKSVENLQNETQESMQQMKKNLDFLKATQAPSGGKFDITS